MAIYAVSFSEFTVIMEFIPVKYLAPSLSLVFQSAGPFFLFTVCSQRLALISLCRSQHRVVSAETRNPGFSPGQPAEPGGSALSGVRALTALRGFCLSRPHPLSCLPHALFPPDLVSDFILTTAHWPTSPRPLTSGLTSVVWLCYLDLCQL